MQIAADLTPDVETIKESIYPPGTKIAANRNPHIQIPERSMYLSDKLVGGSASQLRTQVVDDLQPISKIREGNIYQPNSPIIGRNPYSTGLQITNKKIYVPQASETNVFSPNIQTVRNNALYTQIIKQNEKFIGDAQNMQTLEGTVCPPNIQIIESNTPRNQIIEETPYSQVTQIMNSGILKTSVPEKNMYSLNAHVVEGDTLKTQTPQVSLYSSKLPLTTSSVSKAQKPGDNSYILNAHKIPNNNMHTPIFGKITYPAGMQNEERNNNYPPGTHIIFGDISRMQKPQTSFYLPNVQITVNNTPENQIIEKPVYLSNVHFIGSGEPDDQTLHIISNPTEVEVKEDKTVSIQKPGQISHSSVNPAMETAIPEVQISPESIYLPSSQIISGGNIGIQHTQDNLYLPKIQVSNISRPENSKEMVYSTNTQNMGSTISRTYTSVNNEYLSNNPFIRNSTLEHQNGEKSIYPSSM
jgi:hypothetical protein